MSRYQEIKKYLWGESVELDEVTLSLFWELDKLFGMDRAEYEIWQLEAAQNRFESLKPKVRALATQADNARVAGIKSLNDLVPLLFQHTQYKSYPMSLLEKGRFDMLTKWLDGMTSIDLSGVDAANCTGIDNWMSRLEAETDIKLYHTSGTTGKLSFFPRNTVEQDMWMLGNIKMFEGFGDEPKSPLGFDGARVPCIFPSMRYGRLAAQRNNDFMAKYIAPTPDELYTLTNGTLSADLISLSGRVRVAQSKGELDKFQLSEPMRVAFKQYLEELDERPEQTNRFMQNMADKLGGKRVFLTSQTVHLVDAAKTALSRGIRGVFSADSFTVVGGGGKGVVLPDNWEQMIEEFTGIQTFRGGYGMTEYIGNAPNCSEGHYHIMPFHIPFLLDPETGEALPRSGTQTGRFAFLDLLAHSYWGGLVTGDKVTIEWDKPCKCGRKGAHIHRNIERYSDLVTGDDKVTCSATVDNTDTALQALLAAQ
jgi:hypothetical protein